MFSQNDLFLSEFMLYSLAYPPHPVTYFSVAHVCKAPQCTNVDRASGKCRDLWHSSFILLVIWV